MRGVEYGAEYNHRPVAFRFFLHPMFRLFTDGALAVCVDQLSSAIFPDASPLETLAEPSPVLHSRLCISKKRLRTPRQAPNFALCVHPYACGEWCKYGVRQSRFDFLQDMPSRRTLIDVPGGGGGRALGPAGARTPHATACPHT